MVNLFIIFILSTCLAMYAQKRESKFCVFILIMIVSLVAGLRDYSVGTDTKYYHTIFNNYYNGGGVYFREVVFMYFSKVLMRFTGNDRIVFLFFSFLTNSLIIGRLWKWRDKGSFALMVFLYLNIFFPESLNIMRQFVACAIIFWAFDYVIEKKYKKFILCVMIATCFHISSLVAFSFYPIHYWLTNKNTVKKFVFSLLVFVSFVFAVIALRATAIEYAIYFESGIFDLGMITLARMLLFLSYIIIRMSGGNYTMNKNEELLIDYVTILYGIGIGTMIIGSFYDQMNRVGLSFLLLGIPFEAIVVNKNRYRQLFQFAYILLAIVYFVLQVAIKGEQGIFPYSLWI